MNYEVYCRVGKRIPIILQWRYRKTMRADKLYIIGLKSSGENDIQWRRREAGFRWIRCATTKTGWECEVFVHNLHDLHDDFVWTLVTHQYCTIHGSRELYYTYITYINAFHSESKTFDLRRALLETSSSHWKYFIIFTIRSRMRTILTIRRYYSRPGKAILFHPAVSFVLYRRNNAYAQYVGT